MNKRGFTRTKDGKRKGMAITMKEIRDTVHIWIVIS